MACRLLDSADNMGWVLSESQGESRKHINMATHLFIINKTKCFLCLKNES